MNHITNQNPESTMMGQPTTIVAVAAVAFVAVELEKRIRFGARRSELLA